MTKNVVGTAIAVLAAVFIAVYVYRQPANSKPTPLPATIVAEGRLTLLSHGSVNAVSAEIAESVHSLLTEAGWPLGDANAIAEAAAHAIPLYAGLGADSYLHHIDQLGLEPNASVVRARYESQTVTPHWNSLTDQGLIPPLPANEPDAPEMLRILTQANEHWLADSKLISIDSKSVQVRESANIQLQPGERYTMTTSMAAEWTKSDAQGAGISIEMLGKLENGRHVRIHLLMSTTDTPSGPAWGLAAGSVVANGNERLPAPNF